MVGDRSMGKGGGQGPEREDAPGYGTFLEGERGGEIDLAKRYGSYRLFAVRPRS